MVFTSSEAATGPAWHDPTDVQVRKLMMARLQSHPMLAQQHPILQTREDTGTSLSLLQRLEWMLYHSAGSLSEYLHQPSLERRVQSLVTHYKRKRPQLDDPSTSFRAKRQRTQLTISEDELLNCDGGAKDCVLNSNLDLLHHVCSYLDGIEVLRCRFVSKFLYLYAPSFVRSLHLDAALGRVAETQNMSNEAASGLRTLLHECKNLTSLTISNQMNQTHIKAGVVFPRALAASTRMASASHGYELVREVSSALERGACPSLQTLELFAPFDFASESDATLMVLRALAEAKTEQGVRLPLRHLVLDATFLGDRGIQQLSDLFETRYTFFKHLQTLTVRNNFMGETGCRALLDVIEPFSDLETLDLSHNILTDTDAIALADLLDDPVSFCDSIEGDWKTLLEDDDERQYMSTLKFASLRTLKLHENFITCDGFHAITIALCSREGFIATTSDAAIFNESEEDEEDEEDVDEEVEDDEDEETGDEVELTEER